MFPNYKISYKKGTVAWDSFLPFCRRQSQKFLENMYLILVPILLWYSSVSIFKKHAVHIVLRKVWKKNWNGIFVGLNRGIDFLS